MGSRLYGLWGGGTMGWLVGDLHNLPRGDFPHAAAGIAAAFVCVDEAHRSTPAAANR
jgi:hypothetical protein